MKKSNMNFRKIVKLTEEYSTSLRLNKKIDIDKCLKFYNKAVEYKADTDYDKAKIKAQIKKLEFFLNRYDNDNKISEKFFEKCL